MRDLIEMEFTEEGSLEKAVAEVVRLWGVDAARDLAQKEGELARASLACLPDSPSKESLALMVDWVLQRLY